MNSSEDESEEYCVDSEVATSKKVAGIPKEKSPKFASGPPKLKKSNQKKHSLQWTKEDLKSKKGNIFWNLLKR